uniref:Uncharacterized protein n=1 Tax=Lactuca sativa TaxID=4236 RepID=A0A9R1UZE2_LACSA|nr:hypothetical protein LSAT_V11C700380210 [Lactuca sativa]
MSTTSSSSSHDGGDGGNGGGGEFEGPSHSRQRFNNAVWPEPFLEALATQIAIDAALSFGRLAVAPALTNLFQSIFIAYIASFLSLLFDLRFDFRHRNSISK